MMRTQYRFAFAGVMLYLLLVKNVAEADPSAPVVVHAVAFSRDGTRLAVGYGGREEAGGMLVWNIETKQVEQHRLLNPGVVAITISPDGKRLAVAQFDRAPQVLHWPSLELELELEATRRAPITFSPDSRVLASRDQFFDLHRLDLSTGKESPVLTGIRRGMYSIAFSSDGKQIAAAGWEGGAIVWDMASSEQKFSMKHNNLASCVQFLDENRFLVTTCFDGRTRLWNAQTGTLVAKLTAGGSCDKVIYSKELETLILLGTREDLYLFPLTLSRPKPEQIGEIRKNIVQLDDDSIAVRERASAELLKFGFLAVAELDQASKESASAQVRMSTRLVRETILSTPSGALTGHTARAWCMSIAPNGKLLASGSADGTVRLWDLASRKELAMFNPAQVVAEFSAKSH